PGDLVDVTPYLLGFHPTDSLVLIALPTGGNTVRVTVRADLAEVRRDGFVDYLAALVACAGGRRLLVLGYGAAPPAGSAPSGCVPSRSEPPGSGVPEPAELPDRDVVGLIGTAAGLLDVELLSALYVAGGRWWSYLPCGNQECCPPAGGALLGPHSTAVSEAGLAGPNPPADRGAPPPPLRAVGRRPPPPPAAAGRRRPPAPAGP